jgi:hypothetical protein
MADPEPIYLDYSTLWTYETCQEQARLSFREHLVTLETRPALDFGSAFHHGADTWFHTGDAKAAAEAFIGYCTQNRLAIPISMEADEKRSVERGVYLLDAWIQRWKGESYRTIQSEVYFNIYLMHWRDRPVFICGKIDRIVESLTDHRIYNHEIKTTSMGLSAFVNHCKPNHQVTMYDWAGKSHAFDIAGTIWDCIFISSRKPNPKGEGWTRYGIDFDKDFDRRVTVRSELDIIAFLADLRAIVHDYLTSCDSGLERWRRNAPRACYMYGGCQFIPVCNSNANPQVIKSLYKVQPWEPWKAAVDANL